MRKKILILCSLFIGLSINAISQEKSDKTIDSQITELIEKSNTYQSYKVIKISNLRTLQRNIRDSISSLKTTIADSKSVIQEQNKKIDSITHQVEELNVDLAQTQE